MLLQTLTKTLTNPLVQKQLLNLAVTYGPVVYNQVMDAAAKQIAEQYLEEQRRNQQINNTPSR